MFVFGWPSVARLVFSLVLAVCKLRAIFFVSSQYVYKFDCFQVMIKLVHFCKEASTLA